MAARLPTFYLSHGAGPWPYMSGVFRQYFAQLELSLRQLPAQLPATPQAILVISGHWEERDFAVMASPMPPMVYDFAGFGEELYRIRYPAPGSPALARRVQSLIQQAGLATHLDGERGFDHGTYAVLAVTHPAADVPVIQLSMRWDYDPEAHWKLGRALAPLRDEGVLILGSGSSYHNLRQFHAKTRAREESARFDAWLRQTLLESSPQQRLQRLIEWETAPSARFAHPQEDHLIPLHVALGAAEEEPACLIYSEEGFMDAITVSSYRFG